MCIRRGPEEERPQEGLREGAGGEIKYACGQLPPTSLLLTQSPCDGPLLL